MSMFAHKNYLVHANRVEEKGFLQTQSGELAVFPGDIILSDEYGNTFPVTARWFNDNYLPVEKVQPKPRKRNLSPFEQEFARQLCEFDSLNQLEDQSYIERWQKELTKNKAF